MKMYHIAELEKLSGVKAATIRMWEKRYGFITPERTDTNIRRYDDHQVRKLLNIVTLLSGGYKLAKIAQLSEADVRAIVSGLHRASQKSDAFSGSLVNDLIMAMLTFDRVGFEKAYDSSVQKYGIFDGMLQVVYPFLERIGIMWTTDEAIPVQEHFASAMIRSKLIAATDELPRKIKGSKKFLLLLPPGEWHEIGLLFANYIIRSRHSDTIYLGQNVPYAQVASVFAKTGCTHVLLFFVTRPQHNSIEVIRKEMGLPRDLPLLFSGSVSVTQNLSLGKNTYHLRSPQDLMGHL